MMDPAAQRNKLQMQQFVQSATMLQNGLKQFQAGGFQLCRMNRSIRLRSSWRRHSCWSRCRTLARYGAENQGRWCLLWQESKKQTPLSEQKRILRGQRNQVDLPLLAATCVKKERSRESRRDCSSENKNFWGQRVQGFKCQKR